MKSCPQCGQQNDTDSTFCIVDGVALVGGPEIKHSGRKAPPTDMPQTWSGVAYGVVGGFLAAVLLMGIYITILSRQDGEPAASTSDGHATPAFGNEGVANSFQESKTASVSTPMPNNVSGEARRELDTTGDKTWANDRTTSRKPRGNHKVMRDRETGSDFDPRANPSGGEIIQYTIDPATGKCIKLPSREPFPCPGGERKRPTAGQTPIARSR